MSDEKEDRLGWILLLALMLLAFCTPLKGQQSFTPEARKTVISLDTLSRIPLVSFPQDVWYDTVECAMRNGSPVSYEAAALPSLAIVPGTEVQLTISKNGYVVSSVVAPALSLMNPPIAFVPERYITNRYVMRHEASHFLEDRIWGNPNEEGRIITYCGPYMELE